MTFCLLLLLGSGITDGTGCLAPGLLRPSRSLTRTPSTEDDLGHTAEEDLDDVNSPVGRGPPIERKISGVGNDRHREEEERQPGDSRAK